MNADKSDDGVFLSMNINRMMSHDDMDDDYMCVGLTRTPYHPDDDLEPYFEDDEENDLHDPHQNLAYLSELNPNRSLSVVTNLSPTANATTATSSAAWSLGSVTNHESKKKSQRKPMYLTIDRMIIEAISSEFYQLIQHVDDSAIGLFGRVRLSGGLVTSPSTSSSLVMSEGETPPSLSLVRELLTLLIDHNLIEYEILICYLIYSRRLCGGSNQLPTPSSPHTSPSLFTSSTSSPSLKNTTTATATTMASLPITQHNWKGIFLGLLCLTMKLWDDYSLINKDFIEPLLHQQGPSSASSISGSASMSVSLLQYLNHYELQLLKQFNYSFFITEMEYNKLHNFIIAKAQQIPPRPSTSSRIPSSSSLMLSSSPSPRPSSSHGPSAPISSSVPSSPPPNLSRNSSRSWSWKLRNNRIAVSADDEGN
jgi:hypothetical protein